jgi:hypothetical protein
LVFKPLSIYFKDYTIEDWTNKIDYSKDFHIEPITFHNKYILFNYKKYDTELNKKYNERYGCNFGEYRLSTDYEFNTDTKEIFEYSKIAIPSTDIILSWGNLYSNLSITYTLPAEITAYNKDKNNKNIDMFGCLLFYKGLINFDTTSGMRSVKITDDTFLQTISKTYFYTQDADDTKKISVTSFPLLDIVSDNCLITYTTPKENYTYEDESYNNTNGVYSNFWENYLNERYNINNKIVTCYVYLTQQDYANFEFNKFVVINNQLFFVNKIYDYNMDDNNPTKVDLITIQNINGYTQNKFNIV